MSSIFSRVFVLSALLVLCTYAQGQLSLGSKAPGLELPDAAGNTVSLTSFRGNWVLVDFWASWCMPCRASNRVVRKFYSTWKQKGIEVIGVSLDENPSDWLQAVKKDRITWIQVNTPGQWNSAVVMEWRFDRIPTTYLIDPNGYVRAIDPDPAIIDSLISSASR